MSECYYGKIPRGAHQRKLPTGENRGLTEETIERDRLRQGIFGRLPAESARAARFFYTYIVDERPRQQAASAPEAPEKSTEHAADKLHDFLFAFLPVSLLFLLAF